MDLTTEEKLKVNIATVLRRASAWVAIAASVGASYIASNPEALTSLLALVPLPAWLVPLVAVLVPWIVAAVWPQSAVATAVAAAAAKLQAQKTLS